MSNSSLNKVFNALLKDVSGKICRYTSQEALFATAQSGQQRMYGLAGMNDLEEITYTDDYIFKGRFEPASSLRYNERFILSCSKISSVDDLTMYRLYGNDAKGLCLIYDVNSMIKDSFYIKAVEYADSKGDNPTLKRIKSIVDYIFDKTGFILDFFGDSGWKYFYKPKEYSIEKEVRILYDKLSSEKPLTRHWVITNNNKILNPFVVFDMNDSVLSPIKLTEIILGPKHPEIGINLSQYNDFLKDNKFLDVKISESEIKNYR